MILEDFYHGILVDGVVKMVGQQEWREWAVNWENRRVALSQIDGFKISTVFLLIDHGYNGVPLWFETMIFSRSFSGDEYQTRYSTLEEAKEGHEAAKAWLEAFRREAYERKLGYSVPDWVWKTREHWRKTEGSGNGRVMRE